MASLNLLLEKSEEALAAKQAELDSNVDLQAARKRIAELTTELNAEKKLRAAAEAELQSDAKIAQMAEHAAEAGKCVFRCNRTRDHTTPFPTSNSRATEWSPRRRRSKSSSFQC